jgi:hypothetical protein
MPPGPEALLGHPDGSFAVKLKQQAKIALRLCWHQVALPPPARCHHPASRHMLAGRAACARRLPWLSGMSIGAANLALVNIAAVTQEPYRCASPAHYLPLKMALVNHYVEAAGPCRLSRLAVDLALWQGSHIDRIN